MIKCVLQTCLDVRQCQFGHNCLYRSFDTVFQASRLKTSKKKVTYEGETKSCKTYYISIEKCVWFEKLKHI